MTPAAIPADVHANADPLSKHRDNVPVHDGCSSSANSLGLDDAVMKCLAPAADLSTAHACTRELAHSHYENFSVVSILLPRYLRQDFCNIYSFCRIADDLGDELGSRERSTIELNRFREATEAAFAGHATSALFVALMDTARRHEIPIKPFLDLISAFEQDQRITRYETFQQVVDYCRRSADPVGRLVLYLCGYRDAERQGLSDATCTALQLVNFWQDVRRDLLDRDRIYLPADSMRQFGVTEASLREQIIAGRCDEKYRRLIRFELDRTLTMFNEGKRLLPMLRPAVRGQIALFGAGGMAIADAIRGRNYDTITARPSLSKWQKGRLIAKAAGMMSVQAVRGWFGRESANEAGRDAATEGGRAA